MRLLQCAAVAAVLLTAPAAAQTGPSFDCAKAQHEVEWVICFDPDLSVLDREIAALYTVAQVGPDMDPARRSDLTARQRGWIDSRNGCTQAAAATACITARYGQRILELKTYHACATGQGGQVSFGPVTYECDAPVHGLDVVSINGPVTGWAVVSWQDNAVMLVETVRVDGTRYAPDVWGDPFELQMWHDVASFTRPGQPASNCTQTRG